MRNLLLLLIPILMLVACKHQPRDRHKYSYEYTYIITLPDSTKLYEVKLYYAGRHQTTFYHYEPRGTAFVKDSQQEPPELAQQ